jgi:ABC-type multidrug transport system ATPase subunit/pSer/pThr/pTyr-binding forkhead associated (FHA) protein
MDMPSLRFLTDNRCHELGSDRFIVARSVDADLVLDDPSCQPGCHFTVRRVPAGYELAPQYPVFLNGESITGAILLNPGDRICVGTTLLVFEEAPTSDDRTRVGNPGEHQAYGAKILVPDQMKVILGREASNQIHHLNHLQVSRRHAEISRTQGKVVIRDLGSSNGTYVNNRRLENSTELRLGDIVSLGPFSFQWRGDCLVPTLAQVAVAEQFPIRAELSCHQLTCTALDTKRNLVEDVSIVIRPGEFVCIMGPTGAGKSTLLRALSNRQHASARIGISGKVLLNGDDLHRNFERLKQQIAFVPQHEILFDELDLETSLRFTARLRLPTDIRSTEIARRVDEVLQTMQLSDCRNTRIGSLSGGQRKRASLANELLAEPSLLFLDEVTSGLDEMTDSDMMSLFRKVAEDGKTVVCVTHSLSFVPRDCHRVICLTRFGRLGFEGSPQEALQYFGIRQMGEIYRQLQVNTPEEAGLLARRFAGRQGADGCSSPDSAPLEHASPGRPIAPPRPERTLEWSQRIRQFVILLQRYALRTALDSRSNALRALQCVIVVILVCLVFGDLEGDTIGQTHSAFILILSSYWFGCNNSAKEIVKERGIFEQERRVVVDVSCYAWSKLVLLTFVSAVQGVLLVQAVRIYCKLPGEPFAWAGIASVLALAGVGAGLAVSALSRTEEAAMASVPIILIPQIILAGALAELEGLTELAARVFIPSYWGFDYARWILDLEEGAAFVGGWKTYAIIIAQAWFAFAIALYALHRRPTSKPG